MGLFAVQLEESGKAWSLLACPDYYNIFLIDWYPFNLALFKSSLETFAPQHGGDSVRPSTGDQSAWLYWQIDTYTG